MCRGRDGETLVLVAHGGSLSLPLLTLVPLDRDLLSRTKHHNCAVSELEAAYDSSALHLSSAGRRRTTSTVTRRLSSLRRPLKVSSSRAPH